MRPAVVLESAAAPLEDAADGWQIPIASANELGSSFDQLLTDRLSAIYEPMVLWWTDGSARVQPSCLLVEGPSASRRVRVAARRLVGASDGGARSRRASKR